MNLRKFERWLGVLTELMLTVLLALMVLVTFMFLFEVGYTRSPLEPQINACYEQGKRAVMIDGEVSCRD